MNSSSFRIARIKGKIWGCQAGFVCLTPPFSILTPVIPREPNSTRKERIQIAILTAARLA
jgi:hypothetical protein